MKAFFKPKKVGSFSKNMWKPNKRLQLELNPFGNQNWVIYHIVIRLDSSKGEGGLKRKFNNFENFALLSQLFVMIEMTL